MARKNATKSAKPKAKSTSTSKKRSSRKILDAFQIAERAENKSDSDEDNYSDDDEAGPQVHDGILDASRFLKEGANDEDDEFEDEELDSDEALGSDDDYDVLNSKFSQTIRDKKKRNKLKSKNKGKDIDLGESESEDDEGYSSIDENQLVTLSEAWDMDDKDLAETQGISQSNNKKNEIVLNETWESASSSSSESESEESSSSEEEEDQSSDEDIFDNASDDNEINLTTTTSTLQSKIKLPKDRRKLIIEPRTENEFAIPTPQGTTLSLQEMMSAVNDTSITQSAILIDPESKPLTTPLPKRIQQRHDRGAAYEIAKGEISRWEETVQANRQAEVLKFPMNAPSTTHNDSAITFRESSSGVSSELEKRIGKVLEESALVDDTKEAKFEEIAVGKLSPEEMKKRTQELRLMRELMFRDEKRAKRIKKIKSKQYHKIQKKERLRNQELVDELEGGDEDDDADLKRAQERMSLKHKTQSSWAKSMIKSGLSKDASNRAELEEMLRQGEKLREKQMGFPEGEGGSDEDVSDIERDYNNEQEIDTKGLGKGVMEMEFMKNAAARDRADNLQQLELLRKLENGDDLDLFDEEGESGAVNVVKNQGRRVYTPQALDQVDEMAEVNKRTIEEVSEERERGLAGKLSKKFTVVDNSSSKESSSQPKKQVDTTTTDDSNPWLTATTTNEPSQKSTKITAVEQTSSKLAKAAAKIAKSKQRKHGKSSTDNNTMIEINDTLQLTSVHDSEDEGEVDEDVPTMFKQKELIRQAFAGDDVVAEFESEKKRVAQEEGDQEEDLTLPGWGDWAGDDSKKNKRKKRKVVRIVAGVVQEEKRRDKNLKNVIINEKVNKKNLKYQSSDVPFPFESREQYERSLRMPVGQEWTSRETHQRLTMPRVITKQGTVIDPLKAPFK
ncbi:uncharacterized protein J8A68_003411 [[Candida] subhashii]|uniref:U3 small nucleolar RNA-associated protein 14 n=1 Tax=[Candida] subhashii TaxID=561895 RepID=A0A8J5QMG6_9ASCO|nr:uncharacterized protein J8A68_003411 [[Candida] subhashii]KAG7663068.1 hypothetical protein J8A68_003411 [[Candida] subhashii]